MEKEKLKHLKRRKKEIEFEIWHLQDDINFAEGKPPSKYVSNSKSIYLSSEGRSFVELHTIASELNLSSYARKRDFIFKVGESE